MKFHQRVSLITYLTVIIFVATAKDMTSIGEGWRVVILIGLMLLFNIFIAHTKDDK